MGKKKNKIAKLTEEQYYAYIAGLKNDGALFNADGEIIVPPPFAGDEDNAENKDK